MPCLPVLQGTFLFMAFFAVALTVWAIFFQPETHLVPIEKVPIVLKGEELGTSTRLAVGWLGRRSEHVRASRRSGWGQAGLPSSCPARPVLSTTGTASAIASAGRAVSMHAHAMQASGSMRTSAPLFGIAHVSLTPAVGSHPRPHAAHPVWRRFFPPEDVEEATRELEGRSSTDINTNTDLKSPSSSFELDKQNSEELQR